MILPSHIPERNWAQLWVEKHKDRRLDLGADTLLDSKSEWMGATCIWAHQEFKGAQMGSQISTDGDIWPLDYPQVISGHIHDFQIVQSNVMYIGTPIQHTFSDAADKIISEFLFEENKKYIHNPITLNVSRKRILHITCAEVGTTVLEPNIDYKIKIQGLAAELKAVNKHPNVKLWKSQGHKIQLRDVPLTDTKSEVKNGQTFQVVPGRFSTSLYNRIKGDPKLALCYTNLFQNTMS
jgi:DNA repair exonuclease SbcCD nuclease subunit